MTAATLLSRLPVEHYAPLTGPVERVVKAELALLHAAQNRYEAKIADRQNGVFRYRVWDRQANDWWAEPQNVPIPHQKGTLPNKRLVEEKAAELNRFPMERDDAVKALWRALSYEETVEATRRIIRAVEGEITPDMLKTEPRYYERSSTRHPWPKNLRGYYARPQGCILALIHCANCNEPYLDPFRPDGMHLVGDVVEACHLAERTRSCACCRDPKPEAQCIDRLADLPDQEGADGFGDEPREYDEGGSFDE